MQQLAVIAMMQADGRLVEHVEHAAQLRADLRGQADALAFAAGKRGGGAVERDVSQADGVEEFQPLGDFAHHAAGHLLFALGESQFADRL